MNYRTSPTYNPLNILQGILKQFSGNLSHRLKSGFIKKNFFKFRQSAGCILRKQFFNPAKENAPNMFSQIQLQ